MKIAISIPEPIYDAADRLAKERRIPRSQVFSEAMQEYVSRHGDDAVTAKLDEVYSAEESAVDKPLTRGQYEALDDEAW